jgi:hypothetical protein
MSRNLLTDESLDRDENEPEVSDLERWSETL